MSSSASFDLPQRAPGAPVTLALGTMNFGKRTPAADAERILARAIERGITMLDTANAYVDGESERIVGRAIKGKLYEGRYWSPAFFDLVDAYAEVAKAEGLSLVELSYGWLAGLPHVDSILVGPATLEHLDAAIDACAKAVSPEARKRIDGIHRAHRGTESSYVR